MDIDLRTIIHFAHVARTRSFSRSAADLKLAQPWLSSRIRRLEQWLGCSLFERTTRKVELTIEGEKLLAAAEALSSSAALVEIIVRDIRGDASGRLRLGSPPYAWRINQRAELIERFAARTNATIEIDIGWTRRLLDRLATRELDAAFLMEPFDERGLEFIPFCMMQTAVMMRSEDKLARRARLRPADLAGREVGSFARNLNPALFDLIYPPLINAGAKVMEVAEVRVPLLLSRDTRTPDLLCVILAAPVVAGLEQEGIVRIPLLELPTLGLKLARRTGVNSQTCERFWEMARATSNMKP